MTLDERVAYLEGRMEDHAGAVVSLRDDVNGLRADMRGLRADMRALGTDIQALRVETARQFTWLVGIQVATLVAMVGAVLRAS